MAWAWVMMEANHGFECFPKSRAVACRKRNQLFESLMQEAALILIRSAVDDLASRSEKDYAKPDVVVENGR